MDNIRFSVIIPTYNAQETLPRTLETIDFDSFPGEILAVDGGSSDQTQAILRARHIMWIESSKGRGVQLNEGAKRARGEILVFLHADTLLPKDAFSLLHARFLNPEVNIGTFILGFDEDHWLLKFYSYMTRFDSLWTTFGDQCIVVRQPFFKSIGGFPDWPLFEDVKFLQEARKRTQIHSFSAPVTTSAKRFIEKGIIKQQFLNGWLILQYLLGVSPQKLSKQYES